MSVDKVHLRHCILYEFEKGNNASVAAKNLSQVFGSDTVSERTVQRWFQKFREKNFNLEDQPREGRPSRVDDDIIRTELEANPYLTTRELADKLGVAQPTIVEHIRRIGLVLKYSRWVPHELSEKNLSDRFRIAFSLLRRHRLEPFLDRLVTGDEKWITYNNVVRKRAYCQPGQPAPTTSKPPLHGKKRMLCIWWDQKGPIHYELLPPGETINSEKYCEQLQRLSDAIKEKRPILANRKQVVFQHDNARPHASLRTQQKLAELNWDVLEHPPYSPDLAPSDYYLFQSLQNFLNGKTFKNEQEVSEALQEYFALKTPEFYSRGINKLPERWRTVVESNGNYVGD